MAWFIQNDSITQETVADNGNRLLIGNGYIGIRGTLEEHGKDQLAAINLAGIYDQVGNGWREPLNAPNSLHTVLSVNGAVLALPENQPVSHMQSLDYRHGIFSRRTEWETVTVESRRVAHMRQQHLILHRYCITASAPIKVEIVAGIDNDIWEIYGPHYSEINYSMDGDCVLCCANVQNGKDRVAVGRHCTLEGTKAIREETANGFCYHVELEKDQTITLTSISAIYTTLDCVSPEEAVRNALKNPDYAALSAAHVEAWETIWEVGEVELDGDDLARDTVNYSLYHLNSIAPRHADNLSIPARGLSGQTYKGAIFWDSEMFILDYFLYTQPEVARSMVRYRIDTLPGALEKAKHYGWQGAFYAWESQEGGYDATSDYNVTDVFTKRPMRTFFKDKQVHISSAVARAVMQYVTVTGDTELLAQGGARTILECARFYFSLLVGRSTSDFWEIHDVIGPDEYHERVNNNAYTNKMALATISWAVEAAEKLENADEVAYRTFCQQTGAEELLPKLMDAARKLYVPAPNTEGIIEQFDGYFDLEDASVEEVRSRLLDPKEYWGGAYGVAAHTQVIKQADVVTMLEFFHNEYPQDVLRANWDYYAPRTEHGSSLSACMYALLSCRCGAPDAAYPFFLKSAKADWDGGGKQWAGLVYIGGTHPAAAGGAWKVLAQGFAGLEVTENGPVVRPCLPEGWTRVAFRFNVKGKWYRAELTRDKGVIEAL